MKIICLIGATGSGKDTVLKEAIKLDNNLIPVISHTTRPMRKGEENGKEYHFIDVEKATLMLNNNEFIETRQYYTAHEETWLYGIAKNEIDINSNNTYIAIVDKQGLEKIERYLDKNNLRNSVISIYIEASAQTRLKRGLLREDEMTDNMVNELCRRNLDDDKFVKPARECCHLVFRNETKSDLLEAVSFIVDLSRMYSNVY